MSTSKQEWIPNEPASYVGPVYTPEQIAMLLHSLSRAAEASAKWVRDPLARRLSESTTTAITNPETVSGLRRKSN